MFIFIINHMTAELHFCMCMDYQDHSSPKIENHSHSSRSIVEVRVVVNGDINAVGF